MTKNIFAIPTWETELNLTQVQGYNFDPIQEITMPGLNYKYLIDIPAENAQDILNANLLRLHDLLLKSWEHGGLGDDAYFDYYPAYFDQIIALGSATNTWEQTNITLTNYINEYYTAYIAKYGTHPDDGTWEQYTDLADEPEYTIIRTH